MSAPALYASDCFFNHDQDENDFRILSMCPVTGTWSVTVTELTNELGGSFRRLPDGEPKIYPVAGWGVLADGTVEPLFVADDEITSAAAYRHCHHFCDAEPVEMDEGGTTRLVRLSVKHHICLERTP